MDSDYLSSSPPSSPSLAPVDSSPPSSPSLTAIYTPPGSPGPVHPFAGSTKSTRKPRIYERHSSNKSVGRPSRYVEDDEDVYDGIADQVLPVKGDELPDVTPRPARVVDPFSGSAKVPWRPPTHGKKSQHATPTRNASAASASYAYASGPVSSPTPQPRELVDSDVPYMDLTSEKCGKSKSTVRRAAPGDIEHDKWDKAISNVYDKQNAIIELSRHTYFTEPPLTHISPAIADLQNIVILPSAHAPSSTPPSPTLSPLPAPTTSITEDRSFTRSTTMPVGVSTSTFLTGKDVEVPRGTPAARAASMHNVSQQPTSQFLTHRLQLYLANNSITQLPAELFRVSTLAVLSLRSNGLTHLPPQIAQLTALRELNIAQNKLQWLPAEMLGMRLKTLALAGNPWMPPPPVSPVDIQNPQSSPPAHTVRTVSDLVEHFTVTPLTEVTLRMLLAPSKPPTPESQPDPDSFPHPHPHASTSASPASSQPSHAFPLPPTYTHLKTVLEAELPALIAEDTPPNIVSIIKVCAPAAVAKPAEDCLPKPKKARRESYSTPGPSRPARSGSPDPEADNADNEDDDDVFAPRPRPSTSQQEEPITGISVCPSPRHRAADGSWLDGRVPVFVRHAEERWTWQEEIAGVRVGAEGVGGVGVPVRWRGCSRGCLAFLDPPTPVPAPGPNTEPPEEQPPQQDGQVGAGAGVADEDLDLDLDIGDQGGGDGDVEMVDLTFAGGLADPEDFEEAF